MKRFRRRESPKKAAQGKVGSVHFSQECADVVVKDSSARLGLGLADVSSAFVTGVVAPWVLNTKNMKELFSGTVRFMSRPITLGTLSTLPVFLDIYLGGQLAGTGDVLLNFSRCHLITVCLFFFVASDA